MVANDEIRMPNAESSPNDKIVGRLCQTPRRFTEWSWRAPSDIDGQAGGQVSGSERVKRLTIILLLIPSTFHIRASSFFNNASIQRVRIALVPQGCSSR